MLRRTWKFLNRRWPRRLLILGLFMLIFSAVSIEVTSRPKFCNTCHIMGPYYDSWLHGSHKDVSCVDCHIAPGAANFVHAKLNGLGQVVDDLLNRTSTKPSASVSDFACSRSGCHAMANLGDTTREDRSYHFDHAKHLNVTYLGITMHCSTCHSHVKGDEHFEVNTNVCVTCHLMNDQRSVTSPQPALVAHAAAQSENGAAARSLVAAANCDACHNAPEKPIHIGDLTIDHAEYLRYGAACVSCHRGATESPRPVDSAHCYNCHTFGMERFTTVEEMHSVHAEGRHKVECFSCHGWIRHGPEAQTMSLEQFDCRSCHSAQHSIQRLTYLNGGAHPVVAGTPSALPADHRTQSAAVSPMFLVHVDCTGCHIEQGPVLARPGSDATVARATAAACDNCHRPGTGEQLIPLWQRTTRQLYDEVIALMPNVDDDPDAMDPETARLINEAKRLLDLVRLDGSWGVHNPRYTQRLIEQARERIVKARSPGAQVNEPVEDER